MKKNENLLVNLTKLIEATPDKAILALDIGGAPLGVNQISCVNGSGKQTVNQYGTKLSHCSTGTLNEDQKVIIQNVLKKTQILIGYSISSDITALTKQGIDVPSNLVIVDLYFTVQHMMEQGLIEKSRLLNLTLKGVAEYYGIKNVSGYHDSRVDAKVTMRLFHTIYRDYHGMFWAMMNQKHRAIIKGMAETVTCKSKEENTMNSTIIDWMQDYSNEIECNIYKSDQGFYEALVPIKDTKQIVRMSPEELNMFLHIRKMVPGYPLRVYYLTILAPGIMAEIQKNKEMCAAESESPSLVSDTSKKNTEVSHEDVDVTPLIEEEMTKLDRDNTTSEELGNPQNRYAWM